MYRLFLHSSVSAVAVMASTTACVRSTPSSTSVRALSNHEVSPHQTQRRHRHSAALFFNTPLARFDLRKHEMEKRRVRELEKAGIDPKDNDGEPWIAPEEQQRLDEEEEQRRAEMEEQRKAFLQKRAKEDAVKRQKFKEFRAKQISMSRHRKAEMAERKEEARHHRREQNQRVVNDEAVAASEGDEEANDASSAANESAGGNSSVTDNK